MARGWIPEKGTREEIADGREVRRQVHKRMRSFVSRVSRDGGVQPLDDFVRAALAHQLAENPPTPTAPDSGENAPNARAPHVTAPVRGPR